jgi:hypothetical protein
MAERRSGSGLCSAPLPAPSPSPLEVRARLASARVRQGLPVSEPVLSSILARGPGGLDQTGIYTDAEQQDIYGDNERVALAQALLADAEHVLGGLEVCWHDRRRGVRVRLTGELDRYRRLLCEAIGSDRVVIDAAEFTEAELRTRGREVAAQSQELAAEGIFLTRHGMGVDGFVIEYLAADFERADRVLQARFGDFATIRYQGASNHTFRSFPFGSWLSNEDQLHVFYGLPRNGERPEGCEAFETESAVIVSLKILDWRGAKTLVGGFIPSHATVQLRAPLITRAVIDDAENRSRPHWTDV